MNPTDFQFSDSLLNVSPGDSGYPDDLAAEDTVENLFGLDRSIVKAVPGAYHIPERQWKEKAAENDRLKLWPEDYRKRFTNQSPTHECTCHGLIQNMEICLNRQNAADKNDWVFLSPLSVYAEANPNKWGGSSGSRTLGIAMRRGVLPDKISPNADEFEHTLHGTEGKGNDTQSSGPWVRYPQGFPEGFEQTARRFKPLEVLNPSSFEELICVVLNGGAVTVGRNGHMLTYVAIVWRDGRLHAMTIDSYDRHTFDDERTIRRAVSGSYAITSMQDWRGTP